MANWCSTSYTFHGSEADIKSLYKIITTATSEDQPIRSDFKNNWLGNVLHVIGLDENRINKIPCRGSFSDIEKPECNNGNWTLTLYTETAWVYMPEMWFAVIKELKLETIQFSFYAEELGQCILIIYDPCDFNDYVDGYHIECQTPNTDESQYLTAEETVEFLQNELKSQSTDIDELINLTETFNNESNGYYIDVTPVEYITSEAELKERLKYDEQ